MAILAENGRRNLWFGTVDKMGWVATPNRGADVSPEGWNEGGSLLNGGAYQLNSFNSAKNYVFEWPESSSREAAQLMKSYADGTYGRGLIYFVDPLCYTTNILPAMWADPSMAVGEETNTLVPGVTPTGIPSTGSDDLNLPVKSAYYNLANVGALAEEVVTPRYRNLFINPRTKPGSVWTTVRRNKMVSPNPSKTPSRYISHALVTVSPGAGFVDLEVTADIASGSTATLFRPAAAAGSGSIPLTEVVVGCVKVENIGTTPVTFRTGVMRSPLATFPIVLSDNITLAPGESGVFATPPREVTVGDDGFRTAISIADAGGPVLPAGAKIRVYDGITVETLEEAKTGLATTPLSGDQPAGSVDPDMRSTWVGTPDYSETVLEIREVRQVSVSEPSQNVIGLSEVDGRDAVRVIKNALVPWEDAEVLVNIPESAWPHGVIKANRHYYQGGVLVSEPFEYAWGPGTGNPPLTSSLGAGFSFESSTADQVWWTDLSVFAGAYPGPPFNGASGQIHVGDEVLETAWNAVPDYSTSVAGVREFSAAPDIDDSNSVFIPVPEGFSLHFGAVYASTGQSGVYLSPVFKGGGVQKDLIKVAPSDTDLHTSTLTPQPGVIGYRLWVGKTAPGGASLTLSGLSARLAPQGKPTPGPSHWIGGQGHSGCRFIGNPTYTNFSGVNGGQVGYAASFREVGSWVMG